MKILHLANTPLSNAPANLASCQNHTGHEARLLLHKRAGRNKLFVGGETWEGMSEDELMAAFERADVVHFHNFTWTQSIFEQWPRLLEVAKKKPGVVQFHSARKAHEDFEEVLRDPHFAGKRMVIAQYHPREYPECEWIVPNPLPMHEPQYASAPVGKWYDVPPLSVSYAPSNMHLQGWDYKGYDKIEPALKELRDYAITPDIIINTPYVECLNKKRWSHVGIEEFFTGSYHLSLLEYMALCCVPIGYTDALTKKTVQEIVGSDLPIVEVRDAADLSKTLIDLSRETGRAHSLALTARKWMTTHWTPEKLMPHFDRVYASL